MGLVTGLKALQNGTTAFGSEVKFNDDTITAQVHNIEAVNLATGAVTNPKLATDAVSTIKIVDLAVTTAKLNTDAVTEAKIANGAVQAEHLKNDAAFPPTGIGSPRNELFSKSDNATITNVIAGRQQQGGKIISVYMAMVATTTEYVIDDSMDWRKRIVSVMAYVASGVAGLSVLPGGAADNATAGSLWNAGPVAGSAFVAGVFFTQDGSAGGGANPTLTMSNNNAASSFTFDLYARAADGFLCVRHRASQAANFLFMGNIIAGPYTNG